ncbi:hypothetical protein [Paludisphaera rhizosphaerae]|uniref:hypothetical protein n=1 Tax=Paludisphaera rhizosphaerae TaxID=2711216 RepID=UPI0013ECAD58|nr:hypothetical protein [Paludisphaera rhizosphaerae]
MRATTEIQLDVNTTTAQYTDVGRALLVACRIASGRPAWQRFEERHVVEVDGWRVTLTPDARGGFYTEDLAVAPIGDKSEAKRPRARRKASGKEA